MYRTSSYLVKTFKLLGIEFDSDLARMDTNFQAKIEEIRRLYNCWLYRHLTPLGRVTVIKSLALSKLTHVVLVCPHMAQEYVKELEKMSFSFLWKGKPDRIKRSIVVCPYEKGGLKVPKILIFLKDLIPNS